MEANVNVRQIKTKFAPFESEILMHHGSHLHAWDQMSVTQLLDDDAALAEFAAMAMQRFDNSSLSTNNTFCISADVENKG